MGMLMPIDTREPRIPYYSEHVQGVSEAQEDDRATQEQGKVAHNLIHGEATQLIRATNKLKTNHTKEV